MTSPIPHEIHDQRYLSLATFRKTGVAVYTPIWFAEDNGKLYFMTSSRLWKYKRIRNNPQGENCSVHHPRQNHRPRVLGDCAHPAAPRVRQSAPTHQRKILAGPHSPNLAQHRRLHRNHTRRLRESPQKIRPLESVACDVYVTLFPLLPSKLVLMLVQRSYSQ